MMVEDVERIEVISGPAGTTWGANAMNGTVNIITRNAAETQGGLAVAGGGTLDKRAAFRYGGKIGDMGAWRAYGQILDRGTTLASDGSERNDDWLSHQGGFRTDWQSRNDSYTVQGDIFENTFAPGSSNIGGNVLGRWNRRLAGGSDLTIQTYYTHVNRRVTRLDEELDIVDIDARHNLQLGESHDVVWGGGYRYMNEFFNNDSPPFVLNPEEEAVGIRNIFVQDSIGLTPTLTLTLGVKFEHSTYTGGEVLPNARLGWELSKSHMVWGAVSRAVRTPSRIDRDIEAPGIFEAAHSDFGSESLIAYELGYRGKPDDRSTLSATVYYHDYEELRVITTSPSSGLLTFGNDQDGYITGIESWGDYRLTNRWRISAGVNLLRKSLELGPNASTTAIVQHQGDDPEYQLFLRSFYNLTDDIELDVLVRRIGRLAIQDIPDYTALDLRVGWHVTDTLELALIGSDLLDRQHPETGGTNEIPRSVFVSARWRF